VFITHQKAKHAAAQQQVYRRCGLSLFINADKGTHCKDESIFFITLFPPQWLQLTETNQTIELIPAVIWRVN